MVYIFFFHLFQATVKAIHVAKHSGGEESFLEEAPPADTLALQKSEDITSQVLSVDTHEGPGLPRSWVAFQKAAIVSFQTWALRNSKQDMIGLMIGKEVKKRLICHSVVVGEEMDDIVRDSKVESLFQQGFIAVGVILTGSPCTHREYADWSLSLVHLKQPDASMIVYAPRL